METKQYLNQISLLDRKINSLIATISEQRVLALSLGALDYGEKVQTTPNFDKIGTKIAKLDRLERDLDALVDEYVDKKAKIIGQIQKMDDELLYTVLFSRYVEKKTFEKIATEINYSYRQTTRLHGNALREFEMLYGEEYKK